MQTSDDEGAMSGAVLLTISEESSTSCFLWNNTESMKVNIWFSPCNSDMSRKGQ